MRTWKFVTIQEDRTIHVDDGNHGTRESRITLGDRRALLRGECERVNIGARKPMQRRNEVGGDALRHEPDTRCERGVDGEGHARRADRHARKRFDAATNCEIRFTERDFRSGHIDRFEAGGAKAIDLNAGDRFGETRDDRGRPRDIATLLAVRFDTTEDHVVDERRVEPGAIA